VIQIDRGGPFKTQKVNILKVLSGILPSSEKQRMPETPVINNMIRVWLICEIGEFYFKISLF